MNGGHGLLVTLLLAAAVLLAVLCSLGVLVMNDAFQRLHYTAPVVSLSIGLVAIAVWIQEGGSEARIKVLLIFLLIFLTNAVLSHATARAIRVYTLRKLEIEPGQGVQWTDGTPYLGDD